MLPFGSLRALLGYPRMDPTHGPKFWSSTTARMLSSLVLVELKGKQADMQGATANTLTAAKQLGSSITALVAGHGVAGAAESASRLPGIMKVLVADLPCLAHQQAESYSQLLKAVQNKRQFSHILAPGTSFGKNVLPRAAALMDVQPVSDVTQVIDADTFVRPVYAGNALATVKYTKRGLRVMTVRPTAFPAVEPAAAGAPTPAAPVEPVSTEELGAASAKDWGAQWAGEDLSQSGRPDLGSAKVVVCGGRAMKSADGFKVLERIADLLGGTVGASRAAVDAGYVANDLQVGQTGKVVAPNLYIGVGISGAIQHLAGMKDSKTIVAINTDPEAPIFQVADYGLVQDLFTALPELEKELAKAKS